MAMKKQSLVKKLWQKKKSIKIASLVTILALTTGALKFWDDITLRCSKSSWEYTQLILDTSSSMKEPFVDKSRWETLKSAIDAALYGYISENKLAFRQFGGDDCNEDATELKVPFGKDNKSTVIDSIQKISPSGGKAPLAKALNKAGNDFFKDKRNKDWGKNSIIVITGRGDTCYPEDFPEEIKKLKIQFNIEVTTHLVLMNPTEKDLKNIQKLAKAVKAEGGNIKVTPVHTVKELVDTIGKPDASNAFYRGNALRDSAKYREAIVPLTEAAESIPEAMVRLGDTYYALFKIDTNHSHHLEDAIEWYGAAKNNSDEAMYSLAKLLIEEHELIEDENITEIDGQEVIELLDKLAKSNSEFKGKAEKKIGEAYKIWPNLAIK